ncbi:RNA-binding protein, putative [Plasmodium vivax]|uniref:RNA-binding protein, putative n=1 Tax=Plasmodium vivax TaxID=5855 RepID=A0A1G4H7R3_PLAVI|nr:RNA-binding protein, putative [Plasmodium vivax]
MWFKSSNSKAEGSEKNFGGQEDAINYEEEEQRKDGVESGVEGGGVNDVVDDVANNVVGVPNDVVEGGAGGKEDISEGGAKGNSTGGKDDDAEERSHQKEDASDEEECPLDDTQISEQIESIIKNMSSDEEEEGEVVEDEIPYDRIETNTKLNKEVILLNFYADMSTQRLTSLMSVFGKVRSSFIDDNEGVHVIFNSVKTSQRAKEFLDNLKIKNRRIQVIYGTYQEGRGASARGGDHADGANGEGYIGDDFADPDEAKGTPNDASIISHHDKLANPKNGKTPVKLYKNRKYYQNPIPTQSQSSMANSFAYGNHVKGMVLHVKTSTYFVAPSSNSNMMSDFVSASEMSFGQQEKAPLGNHLHGRVRGGNQNKPLHGQAHHQSQTYHHSQAPHHSHAHHPEQMALLDAPNFSNVANYVQPPPPPPPRSQALYGQSFSESGRGSQMDPYPHYSHPNNQPGGHTSGHPSSHPNNLQHASPHLGSEGSANRMPHNQPLPPHLKRKKMTERFPNSFIPSVYKKNTFEAPPPGNHPPYVPYSNQLPTSSRNMHMKGVPPPHLIGSSSHGEAGMTNPIGGNHPPLLIPPRTRDLPTSTTVPPYNNSFYRSHAGNDQHHGGNTYGNVANSEEYPTQHGVYPAYEDHIPHPAKPPKLAKYSKTVKHSRQQNPQLASEMDATQHDESGEPTPFDEDNPFGISKENQMADNPSWNERKTKQVLQWDQDASVEKNHLNFVDSFGSAKIYNRYLLVTNLPDHLDEEDKVKEYVNGLFATEKMHCFCVEVSLFVSVEVDEARFFRDAARGGEAANKGEEANQDESTNQEEEAANKGEEANQDESTNQEEVAANQGEQQVGVAGVADVADAPLRRRCAHLTFRTTKNCVEAKKALEKKHLKVTFSCPSKANVCLWVGNIIKSFFANTANVLKSMFAHFGPVKNVKYVQDKNCLFIQYYDVANAIQARNHLYGLQVSNNTLLNIDYSTLGEWEGKQHKVSLTRKRLLDALAYDNGKMKQRLESTLKKRNTGFIDSKVMLLLKKGGGAHHGGSTAGGVRIKRHGTDRSDEHSVKRRPNVNENHSPSTSLHRRKHRSSAVDSHFTSSSANDKNDRTRGGSGHSRHDRRESRRSSKRKGTTTSDRSHHRHHRHHDRHHRRHKKRRSGNSGSADGGDAPGYSSRGEEGSNSEMAKSGPHREHAEGEVAEGEVAEGAEEEERTDSDFNSLDGVELNDYNEIQKTVSFYVNQKYKCDFISNFYDGNPELKIYPKLNVETKSDVHNLMNIRNSCIDYSVWQLGPTITQKKKFLHICEHFSKKKNLPVIIDKNFTIFIVPMKEDYLKDLGIDNPDFMYAFVLQTKKL